VALILADQRLGDRHIPEQALRNDLFLKQWLHVMHGTATIDNRDGHVIEGLRAPGADIEDTATVRVIQEPWVDCHDVVHADEIALVHAGTVAAVLAKQANESVGPGLIEMVTDRPPMPCAPCAARVDSTR